MKTRFWCVSCHRSIQVFLVSAVSSSIFLLVVPATHTVRTGYTLPVHTGYLLSTVTVLMVPSMQTLIFELISISTSNDKKSSQLEKEQTFGYCLSKDTSNIMQVCIMMPSSLFHHKPIIVNYFLNLKTKASGLSIAISIARHP